MASREHLVRALWTLFEPIHAVTYFSTQAREELANVGLPRYWDGYFAGRSAPVGAVGGAAVTAMFSGFAPMLANRALPAAWAIASPEVVLEARALGAERTLRDLAASANVPEDAVAAAADALAEVAARVDTVGRPLSAANASLPPSADPYRRLWQAAGTLREHRGDGHVIALVELDIAGITTLLLRSGMDLDAATMQKARGWTDDEWAAERTSLLARGLLDADGRITPAGSDLLERAEHRTNALATKPWDHLDDAGLIAVAVLLSPLADAVAELFPYPNPIGMPVSWNPAEDPQAEAVAAAPGA